MGPIQVIVQDGNNLVLEVTPTPSTTVILDRGIAGPPGPEGPVGPPGSGDVFGPTSSTDNALVRFNGTTGKTVQNSVATLSDTGALIGLTDVDTTNLDVTNVRALDGTASFAIANTTGVMTINDNKFTLQDNTDTTKKGIFELSGITTGTTRTYTLPNLTGTLATTGTLTQSFSGQTTFSGQFTLSSATNTLALGTSQTTGALTMGGTSGTGLITLGRSTVNQQTNIQAGATTLGNTKTINFGTGGLLGSVTEINIGSSDGSSQTTINGNLTGSSSSFNSVGISTLYGLGNYQPNTGFTLNYSDLSKPIASEESSPTGLFFNPDGTKMYVIGSSGDDVNEYALSSPFNVSTATFTAATNNPFSVAGQDTSPADIFFKPDGLAFYIVGDTNNAVFQYTLSTAWDITTASYASKTFSVAGQETNPSGLWFRPNGLEMYVIGSSTDAIYKYNLSTAWDVSTASYANVSLSVAAQDTGPSGLNISNDGLAMYVLGGTGDEIYKYTLSTAWDITTASFNSSFYVGFQETTPTGMYFDSSYSTAWIVGSGTDTVYQYNTGNVAILQTSNNLLLTGSTRIENNAYIDGSLKVDGSVTLDGALTSGSVSTGNLTASQISTSSTNISLGSAQTTGTWTGGGPSQTGAITLGQSTAAQTLNLATGATATATTKTVNIGTAGVSGSTTSISIGSAVSGATSTTTLNGFVVNSISAAVSAAGATQATATLLTAAINNVTVVAAAADGVRLPTAVAGLRVLIRNSDSADTLKIYPATGGQINALGANASFSLAAGATTEIFATTATQWFTF